MDRVRRIWFDLLFKLFGKRVNNLNRCADDYNYSIMHVSMFAI